MLSDIELWMTDQRLKAYPEKAMEGRYHAEFALQIGMKFRRVAVEDLGEVPCWR